MDLKEQLQKTKKMLVIRESFIDYAGPIFVVGNIDWLLNGLNPVVISATMSKEEFIILNNNVPNWVHKVNLNTNGVNNVLVIRDMDKISIEKQELLLDILKNNQISTENLPENLKIILNADEKCNINLKLRDIVEYYEI